MKIQYDREADILFLILRDVPPVDAIEEPGGVIVSYGEDGEPVSVEFLNALARQLVGPDELNATPPKPRCLLTNEKHLKN